MCGIYARKNHDSRDLSNSNNIQLSESFTGSYLQGKETYVRFIIINDKVKLLLKIHSRRRDKKHFKRHTLVINCH